MYSMVQKRGCDLHVPELLVEVAAVAQKLNYAEAVAGCLGFIADH